MILYRAEIRGTRNQLIKFRHFKDKLKAVKEAEAMYEEMALKKDKTASVARLDLGRLEHSTIIELLDRHLCGLDFKSEATVWEHFKLKLGTATKTIDLAEADKCEPSEDDWKEENPQCS